MSTRQPFVPIAVPPTASIVGANTPRARRQSDTWSNEKNANFVFTGDANLRHEPQYYVGIFNVSDMEQRIERPCVNPGRGGKLIIVPAKEESQRYSRPFLIPDILQEPVDRAGSWELGTRGVDGKFLAQDALNPEDPRGNWRTVRTVAEATLANEGTNLYHYGCFWETTGPEGKDAPSEEAVNMAVKRLETTYNRLITEANTFALQGERGVALIGHLHRRAANYFGINVSWNQLYEKKNQCPSCGRSLPVTASRCAGPNGCGYVFNWEKAIADGVANVEEAIAAGVNIGQAVDMGEKATRKSKKAPESE